MERKRWVTLIVGGVVAVAAATAATPAFADDPAETADPSADRRLELHDVHWITDAEGVVRVGAVVVNAGKTTAQRPWLTVGHRSLSEPSAWTPACLAIETAKTPGPAQTQLARDAGSRCLLGPMEPGERRNVGLTPGPPPTPIDQTGLYVMLTGEDGRVPVGEQPRGVGVLRVPPGAEFAVAAHQRATRALRVVVRGLRPGTAKILVAIRRSDETVQDFYLHGSATFARPGRQTVTFRPQGGTLRQLRYALRHGTTEVTVEATYRTKDRWMPTTFRVADVPIRG